MSVHVGGGGGGGFESPAAAASLGHALKQGYETQLEQILPSAHRRVYLSNIEGSPHPPPPSPPPPPKNPTPVRMPPSRGLLGEPRRGDWNF